MTAVMLTPRRYESILARLIIGPSGCWEWTGARDRQGYGRAGYGPRNAGTGLVHRMVYQQVNGQIDACLELDHLCRNTACANPAHLEPVTHRENVRRGDAPVLLAARNAAIAECPRGHPYDEVNTFRRANGSRECRICMRHRNWRRPSRRKP